MQPFLKWPGGKRRVAARIAEMIGSPSCYIEPFVGAGAVYALVKETLPEDVILADINSDLIELYRSLRNSPEEMMRVAGSLFHEGTNTPKAYYASRDAFNSLPDEHVLRSALFVYLNHHCFNGLVRYNADGEFNVPYGGYKSPTLPEGLMKEWSDSLQTARLWLCDFQRTMESSAERGAVIYCDPPYLSDSKRTMYGPDKFSVEDHRRLDGCARRAARSGALVIISGPYNEKTCEVYASCTRAERITDSTSISRGAGRGKREDALYVYR